MLLVLIEHDRGELNDLSLEAVAMSRMVAAVSGAEIHCVLIGKKADRLAPFLAAHGVATTHLVHHELLADYGPATWAASLVALVDTLNPDALLAAGTDRGNEVLAHVGAVLDLPMAANCIEIDAAGSTWELTRARWGGSLHERVSLDARIKLLTVAPHTVEAATANEPGAGETAAFTPHLDAAAARAVVRDRTAAVGGTTLATAPVVVAGGRGVGSAAGFSPLEDLASLLGGVVGCSRVVTNNGWRSHRDQVGQTGTVIAPVLYVACGISGAIQHWIGMKAANNVLAINTDPQAPMVTKATYAVIGDLHVVIPAIIEEIQRRKS